MSQYSGQTEDALAEDARRRAQKIAASEEAAVQAAPPEEQDPSPDAEIAQAHRTGRQHDLSEGTAASQRPRVSGRIHGPRR